MPQRHEKTKAASASYFGELGFKSGVKAVIKEIQKVYCADQIPWIVGYSGGKDSTAVLQLVWASLEALPAEQLTKPVYVISTDTLVENPIVAAWVNKSLERLGDAAEEEGLDIRPVRLTPDIKDTYWVNLIGRGYPAPRTKFRWCTERLKIDPVTVFIEQIVQDQGEAIVVLGTRKAESTARAHVMNRLEEQATREHLRPHTSLPNSFVYSPIESWSNDDVWMFLMQVENPWGHDNEALLTMYRGATADGECPLVVDSTTPSCGDSRFGCWVCTLVEKDRSMSAMIQNDEEKEWMLPLLKLRDELIPRDEEGFPADRPMRDFRRMSGAVHLMKSGNPIPGPYTQANREKWLRKLLQAQAHVHEFGPSDMADLKLISLGELREIRRLWVNEKHEIEDNLPQIYEDVTGEIFPDDAFTEDMPIGRAEVAILKELCGDDDLHFELTRQLVSIERQHRHLARRAGLFEEIERAFKRGFYEDEEDATGRARSMRDRLDRAMREIDPEPLIHEVNDNPFLPGIEDSEPEKGRAG